MVTAGCSEGYNIRLYRHLGELNTQAAEQRNSRLAKLKGVLAYTTQKNFLSMLELHTCYHNKMCALGQRPPADEQERVLAAVRSKLHRK